VHHSQQDAASQVDAKYTALKNIDSSR